MDGTPGGGGRRAAGLAVVALACALRAWPIHVPYIHPDQEMIPAMAVRSLAAGTWRPDALVYPSGLFTVLRATYAVGVRAAGIAPAAAPLAFARDPFPFLLAARIVSCLAGVLGVVLTMALGTRLLGARAGRIAGLLLAVAFVPVREAHYGSLDVPASTLVVAALLALARAADGAGGGALLLAGLAAGAATAFRWQVGSVVPVVVLAAGLVPPDARARLAGAARAALGALAGFAVLSPYALLEPGRVRADLRAQALVTWSSMTPPALPVPTLLGDGFGPLACLAAVAGCVVLARARPRALLVGVLALGPTLLSLGVAPRVFARYVLPAIPGLAIAAAAALDALAARLPRRLAAPGLALGVVLVAADPFVRAVALDRLLAREDTRRAAGRWIAAHVPAGATLLVPGAGFFSNPVLPPGRHPLRAYAIDGSAFDPDAPGADWVVTTEHRGLPSQGRVSPAMAAWLAAHATPVARFEALPPDAPVPRFDPPDANYVPLRGLCDATAPGPDVVVWRIDGVPASGPPS